MPTKAKTSASTSAAAPRTLEVALSEAIALLGAGKLAEAAEGFQRLEAEAGAQGDVMMARSARTRLTAIRARLDKPAVLTVSPELAALVHLNRQESDEALALVEKALASRGEDARLHYLKATALAQKQDATGAAEALKSAFALDQNLIHLFRSEKDFDSIRNQAPLAVFELE